MSEEKTAESQPLVIHAQYARDVSFESPRGPLALRGPKAPDVAIDLHVQYHRIESAEGEYRYESILTVTAHATREEKTIFLAEIHYGTIVSINAPVEQHRPMLMIEVPRLAYPYARQIVTELTQAGGFPPVYLHPVNFHQLYMQRYAKGEAAA